MKTPVSGFVTKVARPLALAASLLSATAFAQTASPKPAPAKGLPSDVKELAAAVEKAGQESAALSSRYSGEFVSAQRSELTPKIGGRVKAVLIDEGAMVESG